MSLFAHRAGLPRHLILWVLFPILSPSWSALGQVEVGIFHPVQHVFGGRQRIAILVTNTTAEPIRAEITFRAHQLTSSIAAALPDSVAAPVMVQLYPRQVGVQGLELQLPVVNAMTRVHITAMHSGRKIGAIPLRVYPQDLLGALRKAAANGGIGVLESEGRLHRVLKELGIEAAKLDSEDDLKTFEGKLVIIQDRSFRRDNKADWVEKLSGETPRRAIVLTTADSVPDELDPHLTVETPKLHAVIAPSILIGDLRASPIAQLQLVRWWELVSRADRLTGRND
jgi:hypothetical protein